MSKSLASAAVLPYMTDRLTPSITTIQIRACT